VPKRHFHSSLHRPWVCAVAAGFALALSFWAVPTASLPALPRAFWVWSPEADADALCDLRKIFALEGMPTNATVFITAENGYEFHLNGSLAGGDVGAASEVWHSVERIVGNLDNATDVRRAAATALGKMTVPSDLAEVKAIAAEYPGVSTRKSLLAACARIGGAEDGGAKLVLRKGGD